MSISLSLYLSISLSLSIYIYIYIYKISRGVWRREGKTPPNWSASGVSVRCGMVRSIGKFPEF